MLQVLIESLGDQGAIVRFDGGVSPEKCRTVRAFQLMVDASQICGIVETTAAFSSVAVYYDPQILSFTVLKERLSALAVTSDKTARETSRRLEIPTCYETDYALDLDELARCHGLTNNELVGLHTGAEYTVAMIGFTPGFPYLLGLPPRLATPRRTTPRKAVPAGSVAIGGSQSGIYPSESPGGWNVIGRTPLRLFDVVREKPSLLQAADTLRFVPIDAKEFRSLMLSSSEHD